MHLKSVLDALRIRKIAKHTQADTTLAKLKDLILDSKTYIPKNFPELQTFKIFFSKITVLSNGTLLKQDKIVLPTSLFNKSLRLANSGAYPRRNGLIRRLRTHYYIKGLAKIVKEFLTNFVNYLLKRRQNTQ